MRKGPNKFISPGVAPIIPTDMPVALPSFTEMAAIASIREERSVPESTDDSMGIRRDGVWMQRARVPDLRGGFLMRGRDTLSEEPMEISSSVPLRDRNTRNFPVDLRRIICNGIGQFRCDKPVPVRVQIEKSFQLVEGGLFDAACISVYHIISYLYLNASAT